MGDLEKQLDPNKLHATCKNMFEDHFDTEEFCEQMCTQICKICGEMSEMKYPTVIGDLDTLRSELQRLIELGKKVEEDFTKCKGAHQMLKTFEQEMTPLNKRIDGTFKDWKDARRALVQAKDEMEDLK